MTHKISWVVDKRVLLVEFEQDVDTDELETFNRELEGYVDYGRSPVHIVADITQVKKLNANLKSMRDALPHLESRDIEWVLFVGQDSVARLFENTVSSAFRLKARLVDTLDEAYDILQSEDRSLR